MERDLRAPRGCTGKRAKASKLQEEQSKALPAAFSPRIRRVKATSRMMWAEEVKSSTKNYTKAKRQLEKKDKLHAEARKRLPQIVHLDHKSTNARIEQIQASRCSRDFQDYMTMALLKGNSEKMR